MIKCPKRLKSRAARVLLICVCILCLAVVLSGCQTLSYYKQAIQGECQILTHRQPIERLLKDPHTPAELKEKFKLVLRLRQYAAQDLKLPTDDQYSRYVDLHRPYVVWNVHAAREFSLEPKTWWYPFVGSLEYRGYFSEPGARGYAQSLGKKDWEVYVEGVQAYSTLGWFKDPLLNTFINEPEPELAEILFHELAHQRLFISGDTDFNEAFATAVGEEGVRRWLGNDPDPAKYRSYATALARNEQFVRLVMATREQLKALYRDPPPDQAASKRPVPGKEERDRLREQRTIIIAQLRENYSKLKAEWGGTSGYDTWFAKPLTNAQLNTVAEYYDLVPGLRAILQNNGGDLEKFFKAVSALGKLKKKERHRRVKAAEAAVPPSAQSAPNQPESTAQWRFTRPIF